MRVVPLRRVQETEAPSRTGRPTSAFVVLAIAIAALALVSTDQGKALAHSVTDLVDQRLHQASASATPLDAIRSGQSCCNGKSGWGMTQPNRRKPATGE